MRAALLTAGHRLLAASSIDALAVDEITRAAGVAKGSFYTHFADKAAFAATILEDIRGEIEARIGVANEGVDDPARRVCRALAVCVHYMLHARERAHVFRRISVGLASIDNPFNQGVLADVAAGLLRGRFAVPSVHAGALFVIGACEVAMQAGIEGDNDAAMTAMAQQLGALLLRGLGLDFREAEMLSAAAMEELLR